MKLSKKMNHKYLHSEILMSQSDLGCIDSLIYFSLIWENENNQINV